MSREQIEREWRLFGCVLPAVVRSGGPFPCVVGGERTRYFYRAMAVRFSRTARACWLRGEREFRQTCLELAKSYLREYRRRCQEVTA